jgi:Sulfotransferase domain
LNPKKGFITGEASPYYIFYPHAARRIYEVMPQVKIIAVLRNPVERAFSHYKYFITRKMPFSEAIKVEQSELAIERNMMMQNENYYSSTYQFYSILSRGIYVDQLRVYENYFGKDAMLILKSEDLFKYPQSVVNQVFKFLNVSPNNIKNLLQHNKQSYKPMDDSLKKYLIDYYKPHNQRLYQFLGKDLVWD